MFGLEVMVFAVERSQLMWSPHRHWGRKDTACTNIHEMSGLWRRSYCEQCIF
jgi:TnpA family transposase